MPREYFNLLNVQADEILGDEKLSEERDWSHNLAGNVKKEVAIDHNKIKNFPEFLITMSKMYYKHTIDKEPIEGSKVSFRVWVVSQYAGDFNPVHIHDANPVSYTHLTLPTIYSV